MATDCLLSSLQIVSSSVVLLYRILSFAANRIDSRQKEAQRLKYANLNRAAVLRPLFQPHLSQQQTLNNDHVHKQNTYNSAFEILKNVYSLKSERPLGTLVMLFLLTRANWSPWPLPRRTQHRPEDWAPPTGKGNVIAVLTHRQLLGDSASQRRRRRWRDRTWENWVDFNRQRVREEKGLRREIAIVS